MNNESCTVTIADIYGVEWWERNKAELDREWEYNLGVATKGQTFVCLGSDQGINSALCSSPRYELRIILHRRKPKPPTLREMYGVDKVTIPVGWEWTGEWRDTRRGESYRCATVCDVMVAGSCANEKAHRLILRERPKRVWFKAEMAMRCPKRGDWMWCEVGYQWQLSEFDFKERSALCATRHEDVDQTVQVVTQEDIDKCGR